MLLGARWFMPNSMQPKIYNFYKSKQEILKEINNADNIDCVICLFSLINKNVMESDDHTGFKSVNAVDDFIEIGLPKSEIKQKLKKRLNSFCMILFNFHVPDVEKKPFMMTPCNHAFHTYCLETWFKQKKECPNCRRAISDIFE
jgi:hypothetical protein